MQSLQPSCWLIKQWPCMLAARETGQNEDRRYFGEEENPGSLLCKYRINSSFHQNSPDLFTSCFYCMSRGPFLCYCFSCILCFLCRCVWSTFCESLAGMLTSFFLSLPTLCSFLCPTLPFCLIHSLCLLVFMTLKAEDSFRRGTGSVASSLEHTDLDNSKMASPSPLKKYHPSLQTLKLFRCSSSQSQSVSLITFIVCYDALKYHLKILRWHVQTNNVLG